MEISPWLVARAVKKVSKPGLTSWKATRGGSITSTGDGTWVSKVCSILIS
jgi:hypothetical protein